MRGAPILALAAVTALAAACTGDADPEWQLDHDRIIAVRATPPSILAGGRADLDALLAREGDVTIEAWPDAVQVVSPPSLADAVAFDGTRWAVTAPDEAALAAARVELDLEADEAVPLQLGLTFAGGTLAALKIVALGQAADNPVFVEPQINGAPAPADEIVIGTLVDVPLAVEVPDTFDVRWLTSCGTLRDQDLPRASLRVERDDPTEGEFALVLRDDQGGVTWKVWSIRAE